MLKLLFGRSGCGKTEYCFSEIQRLVSENEKDILLITPEQYNFTAEKRLLKMLGESRINCVQNLSFTRLNHEMYRLYGGNYLPVLSKGAKAVLMKRAIGAVKSELTLFNKKTELSSFIDSMIKIYDEMKSCNISAEDMKRVSEKLDKEVLADKLSDMSLIISEYESIISGKYFDSSDELSRLYEKLLKTAYIKNKTVFIDGFNGFVANEYKILELIIKDAKNVIITLTTDFSGSSNKYDLFSYVNKTAETLMRIADKNGVETGVKRLTVNYRTKDRYLLLCEENLYSACTETEKETPKSISVYSAKNITDECNYISREIKRQLRSGIRARDIAVICRDMNKYSSELAYSFKKYEIPYFEDERQQIKTQPLIVFVLYLLRTVLYSYRSDDILSLVKTGLTDLSSSDINSLENYIYLWNISGVNKWKNSFENSTKGFAAELSPADKRRLERINQSREYIVSKINYFKESVKNGSAKDISRAVYQTLISFNVNKNLKSIAEELIGFGKNALAHEQERVWDLLMEILNDLAMILDDEKITLKEYLELFSLMVSTEDLGVLPQGVDNVQFGQADRIRPDNPKVVFVLGANEGEFPRAVSSGGLLSESDRIILSENEFDLYSFGETLNFQERYFAYMATSAASERLYVTYRGNEKNASPSVIVTSLSELFENIRIMKYSDIEDIDLVESKASAFELMAERFGENSVFSQSLKEYFKDDGRYTAVKLLSENDDIEIKNKNSATELFGKDMYLSASRLEDYFNCSFRYFCKFGLMAKPREKAQLNAMETGTVIHFVLENIISGIGSRKLGEKSDTELRILVDKYLNLYFNSQLGNTADFTNRFRYQFMRLSKMLYSVVLRLADEFSQSEFEAKAFELQIDKDGAVKPQVIKLDNGTVQIRGAVDRVDVLEKNGEKYIRVVDYKSGNKEFKLADVLYGLNLQMFVYLFTICRDKNSAYYGLPAGVLYMHAARSVYNLGRETAQADLSKEVNREFKMKGLVLYDESHNILEAMEKDLKGKYIPVKTTANNDIKGCFASFEELGVISRKIESLIAEMGNMLHMGMINQNPIHGKNHDKTCEFCDYSDVCANRRIINPKEMESYTDEEVVEILKGE